MASPPLSGNRPETTVVLLVLGAAVWKGGRASPTLKRRALHAAHLYETGHASHIVGCGGVGRHPPSEASLIGRICRDAGVPETAFREEAASTNTLENISFALPILRDIGTDRVAIVSDGYHLPRARLIARRLGLRCIAVPPLPPGPLTRKQLRARLREIPAYAWYLTGAPFRRRT